jgi:ketosteroid isomerase-like protein
MQKIKTSSALAQIMAASMLLAGHAYAASSSDEQAQILKIEQGIAAAQTEPALVKCFDTNVVFYDLTPGVVRGLQAFSTDMIGQFAKIKDFDDKIVEIGIEADDHLAFAYSVQKATWIDRKSGKTVLIVFRQTDCYHNIGGKWTLIHQHDSVPFDPKTGKAVFDSPP